MTHLRILMLCLMLSCLCACRSDAERMAKFCLDFDRAVQIAHDDCDRMADQIQKQIDENDTRIRQTDVCQATTSCLPCRKAVRTMLAQCGYDEKFRAFLANFRFSDSLRRSLEKSEEHSE